MVEIQTSKYHIMSQGGAYRAYVYNYRLANKLNKYLGTYGDYRLVQGEEGIFNFTAAQAGAVRRLLGIKG